MARIAGVDLPGRKHIVISLQYIYGIGAKNAKDICSKAGIEQNVVTESLDENQVKSIREIIESAYQVEGDLRREIQMNIKRLMDLGSFRGLRHRRGLPCRGQRTHTNARTRKGPSRGVLSRKK